MTHREAIKEWLGNIELKNQLVYDWGSGSKPVSRYIKHDGVEFMTIDKNKLIAEDRRANTHITHDIQQPMQFDRLADTAFCIEVLEHTMRPDLVLENINDNLKDGAKLYVSMPYNFRVHSEDDYLRFTENGIKALFKTANFKIKKLKYTVNDEGYLIEAEK